MFSPYKSGKPRRGKSIKLNYQHLEPRQLLASFVGTDGPDVVTVNFESGLPKEIVINGVPFANPDTTLSIDLGFGNDRLIMNGKNFDVVGTASPPSEIQVGGPIETTDVQGSGTINSQAGTVSYTFKRRLTIVTGGGDDTFDINSPLMKFTTPFASLRPFQWVDYYNIEAGEGSDQLRYVGFAGTFDMGEGDDRIIAGPVTSSKNANLLGGSGFDTVRLEDAISNNIAKLANSASIEELHAQPPQSPPSGDNSNRLFISDSTAYVGGNRIVFGDSPTVYFNFNSVDGRPELNNIRPEPAGSVVVFETAYELNLSFMKLTVLGGHIDDGQAFEFQHKILVYFSDEIVVSSSANLNGMNAWFFNPTTPFQNYRIVGLTGVPIEFVKHNSAFRLTLIGSNTGNDIFSIPESLAISFAGQPHNTYQSNMLSLYGKGGDDLFLIGSRVGGGVRDLNRMIGQISVFGGEGDDQIRLDDSDATGRFGYRLRERWIHNAPFAYGDAYRSFFGVYHENSETVYLKGTEQANTFVVTPSETVRYSIDGNSPSTTPGDLLFFRNAPPVTLYASAGVRRGTHMFRSQDLLVVFKSVFVNDFEKTMFGS